MSEITSRNKLTSLLFLAPAFWITTGMLWDGDGDMRLVPIVLAIAVISIFRFRFEVIKDNFKNSFWIKLLLINGLFGAIAYELYGFDSRELRATLIMLFLFLAIPKSFYAKNRLQWFLLVAAISCSLYGYYYQVTVTLERGQWPINAIPFATICGLVATSSFGLLFSRFDQKKVPILIISFSLSIVGLLLSESRGPLISLIAVVFLILSYVAYKSHKAMLICVLLGLIVTCYGMSKIPLVKNRIEGTIQELNVIHKGNYTSSIGIRLQMVGIGFELWQQKPVFGFGKDIKVEFDRLESEARINSYVNRLISMTFHNGYLDKFVLYGVVGGGIFLTFLFYPIWLSRVYSTENGSALLWAPALFIAICNLSDAPFINAQAAIYYMFIIGSVTMMLSNEKERE
ncbi:O-antigen ligase family protein [Vibrio ouci]|uniref:O-antigen ligase domain-containing protein n=1 Tax=Vibrio ouci TaxID=2499078 RepID=A0A4Y8WL00_9VIBR|nr:O-antigen ligase family protein [Vibrio ouci]TFH92971.1 O-antigen ligase domain-containing protein [Vibrio ouci]